MSGSLAEFDVVILGSGPAGLQAAVHAARARATVAVLGRVHKSSLYKAHIENYCCMDNTLSGGEILEQGKRQAEKFGAHFLEYDVLDVDREENGRFKIHLESGETLAAWSLILAMGISRTRLNVPGEKEFLGRGVSYCVECDGNFFRDEVVVVAGSGSAACSGALNLLLLAREVHLVYDSLEVSDHLRYQIERSNIQKHPGRRVKAIKGKNSVDAVFLDNDEKLEATGVFIELGAKGALQLSGKLDIALDPASMKYIATDKKQETNIAGIYAAGDICGPPWQMAKAVGEGCVAGLEAAAFAKQAREKKCN
jgi:thioredoxin reductase (NADPH)